MSYLEVYARKEALKDMEIVGSNMNSVIHLKHHDGSEFTYNGCYYEFYTFQEECSRHRNLSEYEADEVEYRYVTCVIIIPEHHTATWYDTDDLELLEEIKYETVTTPVDLLGKSLKNVE